MDSLWHALRPRAWPALSGDQRADAVVVGGGLAGVSAALALAAAKRRVLLLEAGRLGEGASGRNAGFLLGGAADDALTLARGRGWAVARLMAELAEENRHLVRQVLGGQHGDSGLQEVGSFQLAVDAAEAEHLAMLGQSLRDMGYQAEDVGPEAVGPTLRQAGYRGGLFLANDGQLDPLRLLYLLASGAEHQGARIYEASAVQSIEADGDRVSVRTERAAVHADICILAVNAHLAHLYPLASAWLQPARGQVLASQPLKRPVLRAPVYAEYGLRYFRQCADGRLLMGGFRNLAVAEETTWDLQLNPVLQSRLERELMLLAADAVVEHRWAGIMGFTSDHLPVVGALAPNLWTVGGFSGHGLALAPLLGRQVVEMALGQRRPYEALSPDRFAEGPGGRP